ncbi:unnamed protein product [Oncorhynchus mykiss]|uniref:Uncharacterized protein n=1 Tax=Oncorhynchus mykiss TaxID=8022 RepID=A0A060YCM2_ONCMY|nr:unnamed protein product [Oncorhynchus mykiss]
MWQKVAKFKGAEYFRKALYMLFGYCIFKRALLQDFLLCIKKNYPHKTDSGATTSTSDITFYS